MNYEGKIYRPPSEARSLIIQATIGCSHNKCRFCGMYKDKKFRIRDLEEIKKDITDAKNIYEGVSRIFIADGNALVMSTPELLIILKHISFTFPDCERVGIYATPKDILRKSATDLESLNNAGLGVIYLGVESGNPEVLKRVEKGATREEIIAAGKKIMGTDIKLSVTIISGLGGHLLSKEHAIDSATIVNAISPDYLGILTLIIEEGAPIMEDLRNGNFTLLSPNEALKELLIFLENIDLKEPTLFRSNHASNYISLGGVLPNDKSRLIKEIKAALLDESNLKQESWRQL